jgi:hypothetical protein
MHIALGALCVVVSVVTIVERITFLAHAKSARGTVVELVHRHHSSGNPTWAPVFVFTDENGKNWRIYSSTSNNPPAYSMGESIQVYYNPLNPMNAMTNNFFDLWGFSVFLGVFGTGDLIFGWVGIWWQKSQKL